MTLFSVALNNLSAVCGRTSAFNYARAFATSKLPIAVAMSGGIDSSAAAMLLKDQGYNCVGVFMKNWDSSDEEGTVACPIDQDRNDAKQVCDVLQMPYVEVCDEIEMSS